MQQRVICAFMNSVDELERIFTLCSSANFAVVFSLVASPTNSTSFPHRRWKVAKKLEEFMTWACGRVQVFIAFVGKDWWVFRVRSTINFIDSDKDARRTNLSLASCAAHLDALVNVLVSSWNSSLPFAHREPASKNEREGNFHSWCDFIQKWNRKK